ncbi:hypothetical protein CI109_102054 [Kwoniella shandongensis]|uniref:Clustered mitochondria protein homolog n=1 Tax=Kwoniella shandongensis TaxID=1734106 RepID=A0A5M6BQY3_9TREE|nr:uncharacterized protein CI109_006537 [Kwoniella shandongensis]KAA5525167.1 hypothetical protein CI109_006537 [Kwoniella shandongensis]
MSAQEQTENLQNGEEVQQEVVQANGDGEQVEEQAVTLPPITIRIPSPSCSRTVPKSQDSSEPRNRLTLYPQPTETIQDLKILINDWAGAYWLGPYSLRLPFVAGDDGRGKVFSKKQDLSEIRAGERLNEWLEVQDAFAHLEDEEERVLDIVREPYGEFTARQSVLRLLELVAPAGTSTNTTSTPLALQSGAAIFESVRDGLLSSTAEPTYEEVEVALPSGRKGKGGKKEIVKVKRAVSGDKSHAFADWKADWPSVPLGSLPIAQPLLEVSPCLKTIQISPFNPPPPHLRQLGHQLYLQIALLEGETVTVICSTRGWYVSKSNVNQFDAAPRPSADGSIPAPTHSLVDLLHSISPIFSERLSKLAPLSLEPPALDPLSTVAIPQAEPAYPWLATTPKPATAPEVLRTQLAFLHTGAYGADSVDAARDWNEEIQGIRELPRGSMQERVFREKMLQKVWAEFDQAAVRAVQTVARGDIPPINPAEDPRAHMYLQSNIFITQGDSDALDAYAHLGGDAAMRMSHGKDAAGVKLLNKLDVDGLYMLGHTIVDWQGRRWICQSILPGIFSNRRKEDEDEQEASAANADGKDKKEKKEDWVNVSGGSPTSATSEPPVETAEDDETDSADIDSENPMMIYGLDSERQTTIHWDAATHKLMAQIGTAHRLAAHKVKDGKGEEHEFYASAEVKGLRGTDGRRYLLDAQRLSPVDIEWLEKDMEGKLAGPDADAEVEGANYPHRLVMLRPELLETFWESELKRWARGVADKAQAKKDQEAKDEASKEAGPSSEKVDGDAPATEESGEAVAPKEEQPPAVEAAAAHRAEEEKPVDASVIGDIKQFELRFNPDAFVEQVPPKESGETFLPSAITDESDPSIKAVRDASVFLRSIAIPAVVLDVLTGNTSGLMDGQSLSKHLHGRGINIRYLGHLASTIVQFSAGSDGKEKSETGHLSSLRNIVLQEMVFRASKHVLRELISGLQPETVTYAVSHFLNCLLGTSVNSSPSATFQPIGVSDHEDEPAYVKLTPESLRRQIIEEVQQRFRWTLDEEYLTQGLRKKQLLRELAVRIGLQLAQREYIFDREQADATPVNGDEEKTSNGKDKKKKAKTVAPKRNTTFEPEDILTLVPVVKSTAPSVTVAEEILEAGRNTINRGSIDLGLEFMLEGLQLYENIHSIIHPEVASVYNQYSQAIHQLARVKIQQVAASAEGSDPEQPLGLDVSSALKLQRQAVIVAERTLGVYHHETAGYYFNLAMLENLEGNAQQALRYFRHVLTLWDVIHGPGHPEINTVLSNAGVVLQAINETTLSLSLQKQAYESTLSLFGSAHIQTGQSLHQLTQAHFLAGDMPAALSTSEQALAIFTARLGEEHGQTKEVKKNVELLRAVLDNVERQKERNEQAKKESQDRLKLAKERVGQLGAGAGTSAARGRRLGQGLAGANGGVRIVDPAALQAVAAAAAAANGQQPPVEGQASAAAPADGQEGAPALTAEEISAQIGARGTESVDELVRFIQGQQANQAPAVRRGKNALRGKRRTGAKR